MDKGHRIKKRINVNTFRDIIAGYSKDSITCTDHTFFRLSEKQRKIFTCKDIKEYILENTPVFVGVQYNDRWATFYKHKKKRFIRIILHILPESIKVVTFYILEPDQIPRIK